MVLKNTYLKHQQHIPKTSLHHAQAHTLKNVSAQIDNVLPEISEFYTDLDQQEPA